MNLTTEWFTAIATALAAAASLFVARGLIADRLRVRKRRAVGFGAGDSIMVTIRTDSGKERVFRLVLPETIPDVDVDDLMKELVAALQAVRAGRDDRPSGGFDVMVRGRQFHFDEVPKLTDGPR